MTTIQVMLGMAGALIALSTMSVGTVLASSSNDTIDYDAIRQAQEAESKQGVKQMVESAYLNQTCLSSSDRMDAIMHGDPDVFTLLEEIPTCPAANPMVDILKDMQQQESATDKAAND